ncbi:hypothetical protein IFHNHDMJ_00633 [Synechococcus sp. CBW1107]|nr:hypothetical protein IFHNHDMJ_00633 [Synechococcus sp. CBW1107]
MNQTPQSSRRLKGACAIASTRWRHLGSDSKMTLGECLVELLQAFGGSQAPIMRQRPAYSEV